MSFVMEILQEYLKWEELKEKKNYDKLSSKEKDDLRLENDRDAMFYYKEQKMPRDEALRGDTMVSFWTPYKRLLEVETGWKTCKTQKCLKALIRQINADWDNDYTKKLQAVNEKLEPFAEIYWTKGNFIQLPERKMNNERYNVTEDRIDWTLYECFGKGKLSGFFREEEELKTWVREQKLTALFQDQEICRDHIKWLVQAKEPLPISKMKAADVYEYLENAAQLIQQRNGTVG